MSETRCPGCDTDLTGAPIPQQFIARGYHPDGATHYTKPCACEKSA
jgi:hypothetical protein